MCLKDFKMNNLFRGYCRDCNLEFFRWDLKMQLFGFACYTIKDNQFLRIDDIADSFESLSKDFFKIWNAIYKSESI